MLGTAYTGIKGNEKPDTYKVHKMITHKVLYTDYHTIIQNKLSSNGKQVVNIN